MDKQRLLSADYLDILFDNRNKQYGGYELRRHYSARARRATYAVLLAAGMLSSIPVIAGMLGGKRAGGGPVQIERPVTIVDTRLPQAPERPRPVARPALAAPIAPTVAVLTPKIVPDQLVPDDAPRPVDSLGDRMIGKNTNDGHANGLLADDGQADGIGKVPADQPVTDPPARNDILIEVSQMPQFNGDIGAYLQQQLVYPESARQNEQQGRAVVKFVVSEDGAISHAEIVRTAGFAALDAEALRVVSAMPRWKPGKQQGVPVRVYFNLPITFRLD